MDEKIQEDIDNLYKKVNKLDKAMVGFGTNQEHYTKTLEKVADSNEKLVDTLQSMQIAFVKMDTQLNNKMDDMSCQIKGVETRVKKIECDNSFEIMLFIKKNFPWIVVGVGVVALWASRFMKL